MNFVPICYTTIHLIWNKICILPYYLLDSICTASIKPTGAAVFTRQILLLRGHLFICVCIYTFIYMFFKCLVHKSGNCFYCAYINNHLSGLFIVIHIYTLNDIVTFRSWISLVIGITKHWKGCQCNTPGNVKTGSLLPTSCLIYKLKKIKLNFRLKELNLKIIFNTTRLSKI